MSHDPFDSDSAACEEETKAKRSVAKYYIVKEVEIVCETPAQVRKYFEANYEKGMSVIKGIQTVPTVKETYEF